jgi:hypothetical protein
MQIRIKELRGELKASEEKCSRLVEKGVVCDETVSCVHRNWDQVMVGTTRLFG